MRIALDFHGTVVDTMLELAEVAARLLNERYSVDVDIARDWYRRTAGAPFQAQLEELLPDEVIDDVARAFAEEEARITLASQPFDDVLEALEDWNDRGHFVGVISGSPARSLVNWLVLNDLDDLIDDVIGYQGSEGGKSKVAQLWTFEADVFIGDTNRDAAYAAEADVRFLGVCRDPRLLSPLLATASSLINLELEVQAHA